MNKHYQDESAMLYESGYDLYTLEYYLSQTTPGSAQWYEIEGMIAEIAPYYTSALPLGGLSSITFDSSTGLFDSPNYSLETPYYNSTTHMWTSAPFSATEASLSALQSTVNSDYSAWVNYK